MNKVIGGHRGENTKLIWSFQTVPKDGTYIKLVNGPWGLRACTPEFEGQHLLKSCSEFSIHSDVHFLL